MELAPNFGEPVSRGGWVKGGGVRVSPFVGWMPPFIVEGVPPSLPIRWRGNSWICRGKDSMKLARNFDGGGWAKEGGV